MKWFQGSISEAVQYSQGKKAIFCVVILGSEDDLSQKYQDHLGSPEMLEIVTSEEYVWIKLELDSTEHHQFSQIYPDAVSGPCIYCITDKGKAVEIINTSLELVDFRSRLQRALAFHRIALQARIVSQQNSPQSSQVPSSSNIVPQSSSSSPPSSQPPNQPEEEDTRPDSQLTLDERVERAKRLLAAKQELKRREEEDEERRREKERREGGKGFAELKRWQEEQEQKKILEERKKDKLEDQKLRQKIKEQIAADRAARNARTNVEIMEQGPIPNSAPVPSTSTAIPQPPQSSQNFAGKVRLQFRLPDGSSQTRPFEPETTMGDVHSYIKENRVVSFNDFSIWMAYPRREFTAQDYALSLRELNLVPSASLLILPKSGSSGVPRGGSFGSNFWIFATAFIGMLLYPLNLLMSYIRPAITSGPSGSSTARPTSGPSTSSSSGSATQQRSSVASEAAGLRQRRYQQQMGSGSPDSTAPSTQGGSTNVPKNKGSSDNASEGNIHRLRNRESDSDEEKATWNGNSTQQM